MVVAKVGGIVKELKVEEGDIVKAGDLLAQLEATGTGSATGKSHDGSKMN